MCWSSTGNGELPLSAPTFQHRVFRLLSMSMSPWRNLYEHDDDAADARDDDGDRDGDFNGFRHSSEAHDHGGVVLMATTSIILQFGFCCYCHCGLE